MNRVFDPGEILFNGEWWPIVRFGWPRDFRRGMFFSFAFGSIGWLVAALYVPFSHPKVPLLRNLLVGPTFMFCAAVLAGIAAWTIWKARPSARGWAIAASVLYLFIFIRPFLIPMRHVWGPNLLALVLGLGGIAAFAWPDSWPSVGGAKPVDSPHA